MSDTYEYKGYVRCGNCNLSNKDYKCEIPKGTKVKEYLRQMTCDNCGVRGKLKE